MNQTIKWYKDVFEGANQLDRSIRDIKIYEAGGEDSWRRSVQVKLDLEVIQNKMRVADYIAKRLKNLGCEKIYMVTGGAAMHLNDAFRKEFKSSIHCLHHEQSCAMAADAYARITGKPV